MQILHSDLDETTQEATIANEKSRISMVGAARLADELRNVQEMAQSTEKERKLLECQVKDSVSRLDETE